MANILKHVDLLDLITVNIFRGQATVGDPNPYVISVVPLDQTKRVVFDADALKALNNKLTEKIHGKNPSDPNTISYMKEFASRMISELYRNGLVLLEDIPDAKDDPYEQARKMFKGR